MGEDQRACHHLIVHRNDCSRFEGISTPVPEVGAGEALLRVEKFGLTSNNVTYAALGDALPYFDFFPVAQGEGSSGWSRLPVWGMGRVIETRTTNLEVGQRLYGFFPAASHATLNPVGEAGGRIMVKRSVPAEFSLYNLYSPIEQDPFHQANQEDLMVVTRPVFLTALLLADHLAVSGFYGADSVLISSAASKTAYGLALALRGTTTIRVLGLCSTRSRVFAESMGVYEGLAGYDQIRQLPQRRTLYVDVSGNPKTRRDVAGHLADRLTLILSVGLTHWREGSYGDLQATSATKARVFFAPAWNDRRRSEKGGAFLRQLLSGWKGQMQTAGKYFEVVRESGETAVERTYLSLLEGRAKPNQAPVLSL